MKNSIRITFAAVLLAGAAACTSAPAPQQNSAPVTTTSTDAPAPVTTSADAPAPAPSTTVVTEVVTSTVTNPPKAATRVDTRIGYGALKLGMTMDEVKATGMISPDVALADAGGGCWWNNQVLISSKYGLVRITLPAEAKTSAGIGVGSTFADVKRAYPDAKEYREGFSAKVADNAHYAFVGPNGKGSFADTDEVTRIKLSATLLDCSLGFV